MQRIRAILRLQHRDLRNARQRVINRKIYRGWVRCQMTELVGQFDYAALFEELPSSIMILDRELRFLGMNAHYLKLTESTREALMGQFVFDVFPESSERRQIFETAFRQTVAGQPTSVLRQRFDIRDGNGIVSEYWWDCHHIPVADASGAIVGMLQQASNVTAQVRAERLRAAVMSELDHRVKNIISKVQAIARRTAVGVEDIGAYLEAFDSRLSAMARAQALLFADAPDKVSLRALLATELAPYKGETCANGSCEDIDIAGGAALSLGLAFHELASNAAKHGAFANQNAQLNVDWSVAPDRTSVIIRWIESGVAMTGERGSGFGSTILQRIVPGELGAKVDWRFTDDGVACIINLPFDGVAIGEAGPSIANLVAIRAA